MSVMSPSRIPKSISIADFLKTYGKALKLEVLTDNRGLKRRLKEGRVNRPALALTGFFKYFSNKCVQVFGAAEMTYLKSFNENEQYEKLKQLVKHTIPCIVLTRNYLPTKAMLRVVEEKNLPLLRTSFITRHFINAATVYLEFEFAPRTTVHGTLMDIGGTGTLIRGSSGVGKSECALALIERGHSLVADDLTYVSLIDEHKLMGRSSELNRGYMECRGIGIINVAEMFGIRSVRVEKEIALVVTFRHWAPGMEEERTGLDQDYFEIHGIKVPHIELLVRPGRDMARLVEVAALGQALKSMGHDSAREFNERLIAHMRKK